MLQKADADALADFVEAHVATAASATAAAEETTSSTSYTDLATTTDTVTVTVGVSGIVQVSVTVWAKGSAVDANTYASFTVSGANTLAADDLRCTGLSTPSGGGHQASGVYVLTGLNPGATTFKMRYRVSNGTGTFSNRTIAAIAF